MTLMTGVCNERLRLAKSLNSAALEYSRAVSDLHYRRPMSSDTTYSQLLAAIEVAKKLCRVAREDLYSHIANHRCLDFEATQRKPGSALL
jgi:hypothetical protein